MALNKARTSVWMKAFIIILIIAFVGVFVAGGFVGIFDLFQQSNPTGSSTVDPIAAINQKGQQTTDALKALVASQPTSYTATVNLANAYFDWAQQLSTPQAGQSQITTPAMTAAFNVWSEARATYEKAAKIKKALDPPVQTDRSIATFYSNDATSAIKLAQQVTKAKPDFAPAWLNLGLFYDSTNNTVAAIAAYKKYLALDPKGGSATFATNRIKAIGGSSTTASGTP